jgi:hypothetical protein
MLTSPFHPLGYFTEPSPHDPSPRYIPRGPHGLSQEVRQGLRSNPRLPPDRLDVRPPLPFTFSLTSIPSPLSVRSLARSQANHSLRPVLLSVLIRSFFFFFFLWFCLGLGFGLMKQLRPSRRRRYFQRARHQIPPCSRSKGDVRRPRSPSDEGQLGKDSHVRRPLL